MEDLLFFDSVLVLELIKEPGKKHDICVNYRLPRTTQTNELAKRISGFCFPDATEFPKETMENERFSFVLTDSDAGRKFGYCLRHLRRDTKLPIAYTVITSYPCPELYYKIVERIAYHYENSSSALLTQFLESVIKNSIPPPGKSFTIELNGNENWNITREENQTPLNQFPIDIFLSLITPENIVKIFSSLLLERRIIYCASTLANLSIVVQAMMTLIYPFTWQHIYIPILPESLLDCCCAPMPFVVGILRTSLDRVEQLPMEPDVLIFDVDNNVFRRPTPQGNDDIDLLPDYYKSNILRKLKETKKLIRPPKARIFARSARMFDSNKIIEEIQTQFLDLMTEILGPAYKLHFSPQQTYNLEAFKNSSRIDFMSLLEQLTSSQLFSCFIRQELFSSENSVKNQKFEQRIRNWLNINNFQAAFIRQTEPQQRNSRAVTVGPPIKKELPPIPMFSNLPATPTRKPFAPDMPIYARAHRPRAPTIA